MAKVTVTGNAWDHSREVIPSELRPRLWARPVADQIAGSLLVGVSSRASLNLTTGAFAIELESGLDYTMWMDWLMPGQESEPPGDRAMGRAEWPVFNSASGGSISALFPAKATGTIVAELAPPPPEASGIIWIDLTDVTSEGVLVYGPGGN